MNPKISIIVPVFNQNAEFLEASLGSIMIQTFREFECIVIDESTRFDCSSTCEEICARDSRFSYVRPKHRLGLAGSLNLGISLAKGELIARFDSDDICLSDRLALQVSFMDSNPQVGVLGGGVEVIDGMGTTIGFRIFAHSHLQIARQMQVVNGLAHPTVIYRSEVVARHGFYNEAYKHCEDLELWLRWLNSGVIFSNLPNILIKYRMVSGRNSDNWRYNLKARIKNFSSHFLFIRLFGILFVATVLMIPKPFEVFLYSVARHNRILRVKL